MVWDSGQFHHVDGHFTTVMDVEIGHLGDPMMDLAAWRMRETVIPFGDFNELYDRYGETDRQAGRHGRDPVAPSVLHADQHAVVPPALSPSRSRLPTT